VGALGAAGFVLGVLGNVALPFPSGAASSG